MSDNNNKEIVRSSKKTKITEFESSFGLYCEKDNYLVDLFSITPTASSKDITSNEKEMNLNIFHINRGEHIEIRNDGKSVNFGSHYNHYQLQIDFAQKLYVAWRHLKRNRNEQSFVTENFKFGLCQTAISTLRECVSKQFKLDCETPPPPPPPSYLELTPPSTPSIELGTAFSNIQLDIIAAAAAADTDTDSSAPPSYEFLMNSKQI